MLKVYYIDAEISGTCFLAKGKQAILFDPGMAYYGSKMISKVEELLDGQPLDAVFLTHSHYDHVAALPYVKERWPGIKVYAAEYACHILKKTKVRQMMVRMSEIAAKAAHSPWTSKNYHSELIDADVMLYDGDRIRVGDLTVEVIETIGHTQCSMSFMLEDGIMISSETIGLEGNMESGYVPAFLISYKQAVTSLERTKAANPTRIYMPHRGLVIPDQHYWTYMEKGLQETKEEIVRILVNFDTPEDQLLEMEEVFWKKTADGAWPKEAFDMNAKAMLRTIAAEFPEEIG